MQAFFRNINEFYERNPSRRHSLEVDYGSHWRLEPWPNKWRVSYIKNTGEIYAVHLNQGQGPLIMMGEVAPDEETGREDRYYRTLDQVLEGHPEMCLKQTSVEWIADQLDGAGYGPRTKQEE